MGPTINSGDYVHHSIDGEFPEFSYVIGTMTYSDDVVCVATEQAIGMPIHKRHCRVISKGTDISKWRNRYLDMAPGTLKP